ncbi:MAG TPA: LTA synthase family protein [Usitatibacteraceae bacterium]|nr:LTA synthase family protein [Usitatibacteraceae bacterium]
MPRPRIALPFAVVVLSLSLLVWLLLRGTLWAKAGLTQIPLDEGLRGMVLGLWFDAATIAYLLLPLCLLAAFLPERWRQSRVLGWVRTGTLAAIIAVLLFGAAAEWLFWDEFSTRFNFIAVDYLIYTHEVIGNIRQSYPVGWILAAIAALAAALTALLHRHLRFRVAPRTRLARGAWLAAALLLPVASFQFADVDQMAGAGNEFAKELSGNGLFTLASAMRRNELDYDRFYKTLPQAEADATLKRLGVARQPLEQAELPEYNVHEPNEMGPFKRSPRNVVLISVESLSAEFLGAYGGTRDLTPRLDQLAREGLMFANVYATGTRTVRGLEALSLGTPPVPGQAIVRRPNNEHLATIGELLEHQGFQPYFIYGGYGYFDNMNAYFAGNDYKVVDRTDFSKASIPFENIWGVADEALFDNALEILDQPAAKGQRFFAQIMTTSNHRPFTYPPGRIDIPSPGGRDGAVKYTDYAIGRFIDMARKKPWFNETLFVIVADHCASVAGKTRLPVASYRIPMIFYAPSMLPAGRFEKMVSQIDLPPTLIDVLGAQGEDHYFGESIFESAERPPRAFISNYQELGYYKGGILTVLSPKKKVDAFRIDQETFAATPAEVDPALEREAIAFYQTGARAFKRNALRSPAYAAAPAGPSRLR